MRFVTHRSRLTVYLGLPIQNEGSVCPFPYQLYHPGRRRFPGNPQFLGREGAANYLGLYTTTYSPPYVDRTKREDVGWCNDIRVEGTKGRVDPRRHRRPECLSVRWVPVRDCEDIVSDIGLAASIHGVCRVRNKDIRKFLDGIYVSEKGTISEE